MSNFTYDFIPQFADTDAAGIVHFAKILCFVEEAEHQVLHTLGYAINPVDPACLQWPRVACTAEYLRPLKAFEALTVHLTVKRLGKTSLTWHWEIHGQNNTLARGELKTVCCQIVNNRIEPGPIPEALRKTLSA